MTRRPLLVALALLLASALASPASALCSPGGGIGGGALADPRDGMGGTGHDDPRDGIGGTGRDPGDGIGGTGREDPGDGVGGTGVFGVVSQLAPLCVGGVALEVGPQTSIERDGEPAELAVGQVVWALGLAASGEDETLEASQIEILAALRGRFEGDEGGQLVVAGTLVAIEVDVPLVDGRTGKPVARDSLRAGDRLEVSGLRDAEDRLVATRIERVEGERPPIRPFDVAARARRDGVGRVTVEGLVQRPSRPDRVRVAGLEASAPERPATLRRGERVRIRARIEPGGVRTLGIERTERPERPPERVPDRPVAPPPTPVPDRPSVPEVPDPTLERPPELPERPPRPPDAVRRERPVRPEVPPRPEIPERPEVPERPSVDKPERPVPTRPDRPAADVRPAPVRDVTPSR